MIARTPLLAGRAAMQHGASTATAARADAVIRVPYLHLGRLPTALVPAIDEHTKRLRVHCKAAIALLAALRASLSNNW
jgi:hypothetical protein